MNDIKTCIIGIGHPFRGDDGFGPAVIDALTAQSLTNVNLVKNTGDIAQLMPLFETFDEIILVDVLSTGEHEPGTLFCFDGQSEQIQMERMRTSTHAFSISQMLQLSQTLGCYPNRCTIVGVEGFDFNNKNSLSEQVKAKIPQACKKVISLINSRTP